MGKTINKGPCYCCEQSSSSVTSSVSSSTSSVTSSVSVDFCCSGTGSARAKCEWSHDGGGCGWFYVNAFKTCTSNCGGRAAHCWDNLPGCIKEVWCVMPGTPVTCGPNDNTNCPIMMGVGPYDCIGILNEGASRSGTCAFYDGRAGSPCQSHGCNCVES